MFVRNLSHLSPVLVRGHVLDDIAVATVSFEQLLDIADDGRLTPVLEPAERAASDPPDIRRTLLWRGTSVTASASTENWSCQPSSTDNSGC